MVERETHCYIYLVHIRGDKTHCRQESLFVAEDYCRVGCKPFLFFQTIDECRYIARLCHFGRCRNNRNIFRFFDIVSFEYCCRRELLHIFFDKLTCFYKRIVEKIFVVIPIVEALRAKIFHKLLFADRQDIEPYKYVIFLVVVGCRGIPLLYYISVYHTVVSQAFCRKFGFEVAVNVGKDRPDGYEVVFYTSGVGLYIRKKPIQEIYLLLCKMLEVIAELLEV